MLEKINSNMIWNQTNGKILKLFSGQIDCESLKISIFNLIVQMEGKFIEPNNIVTKIREESIFSKFFIMIHDPHVKSRL